MKNITIRNITENDIESVADIRINGWKTAYKGIVDDSFLNSMNREDEIKKRRQNYKTNRFIVAESEGETVGFCIFTDSNKYTPDIPGIDCELLALYVKPELKRNGIGTELFKFAAAELKTKSKNKMILWCLKDNIPSRNFYKKTGGSTISERSVEINGKEYSEVGYVYEI